MIFLIFQSALALAMLILTIIGVGYHLLAGNLDNPIAVITASLFVLIMLFFNVLLVREWKEELAKNETPNND